VKYWTSGQNGHLNKMELNLSLVVSYTLPFDLRLFKFVIAGLEDHVGRFYLFEFYVPLYSLKIQAISIFREFFLDRVSMIKGY
jgi:hypothetical protein